MTNFKSQMDAILAQNGLDVPSAFGLLPVQTIVALMQTGKSGFAQAALPEGLAMVSTSEEVHAMIQRLVTDEAFVVTNLRALAKYLESALAGKEHDVADIAKFYEAYQSASDADKRDAQIGTLRLIDAAMNAEVNRVRELRKDKEIPEATDADFNNLLAAFEGQGMAPIFANFEPALEFALSTAQCIYKGLSAGHTLEESLDGSAKVLMFNNILMKAAGESLSGEIIGATFKNLLPADQFELVEAMGQREAQRLDEGDAAVSH